VTDDKAIELSDGATLWRVYQQDSAWGKVWGKLGHFATHADLRAAGFVPAAELAEAQADNKQHCHDFQAIAHALGILDELPEMPRVLERIAELSHYQPSPAVEPEAEPDTAQGRDIRTYRTDTLTTKQPAVDPPEPEQPAKCICASGLEPGTTHNPACPRWRAAEQPTAQDPRLAVALAHPPGPRHARLVEPDYVTRAELIAALRRVAEQPGGTYWYGQLADELKAKC
jgi:hypothetical protein